MTRAEADATSTANGGGVASFQAANSLAQSQPTVNAFIASGAAVIALTDVSVKAKAFAIGTPGFDDNFDSADVNTTDDTIQFPAHGLSTGDTVIYGSGATAIGTPGGDLSNDREFTAISSMTTICDSASAFRRRQSRIRATSSTGAPGVNSAIARTPGVDPTRDIIRFAVIHRFQNGDAVRYDPPIRVAHQRRHSTPPTPTMSVSLMTSRSS